MKKLLTFILASGCAAALVSASVCAQEIKGNAAAGEKKNALCIGCHGIVGFKTGFPEVYRVPKISGQSAGYIVAALGEYKRGARKHPSMRGVAETLSDQDMADLAAYFESNVEHASTATSGRAAADTEAAMALVTRGGCAACHGANFNKPTAAAYPKVAGQHADYLYAALKAYKSNDKTIIGRNNPIMSGIAKQFTDAELQTLVKYLESLPGHLVTVQRGRFR